MALELNSTIEAPIEDTLVDDEPGEEKQNLFIPFLKSIHTDKNNLLKEFNPEFVEKQYDRLAYIINRNLSNFKDTVLFAQEMNQNWFLDGKMQYLFLLHGVPSGKRFTKIQKPEDPENLEIVKEYYGYTRKKARKALEILSESDIEYIKARLNKGGLVKKKRTKEK